MRYIPGKTHLEAQTWGRGWIALWAGAGHKRLRHVHGPDGRATVFPTKDAAIEAALQAIQRTEPTIRAELATEGVAAPAVLDVAAWKEERQQRQVTERREAFRGLGKGFLTVETKRRRALSR